MVKRRYTTGVPFRTKMVYKRVRGWTSGRSNPVKTMMSTLMSTPLDKNFKKGKQNIDNVSMAINLSVCLSVVSFRGQIRHEICSNWFHLATSIPPVSDMGSIPASPGSKKNQSFSNIVSTISKIHQPLPTRQNLSSFS